MKLIIKNQKGETKTIEVVSITIVKEFGLVFFTMYIDGQKIGKVMLNEDRDIRYSKTDNLGTLNQLNNWLMENFKIELSSDIIIEVDITFIYTHIYQRLINDEYKTNYEINHFQL